MKFVHDFLSYRAGANRQNKHENITSLHGRSTNDLSVGHVTINSAIADKPRDAFRGQSRSPNDSIGLYGFLLVCNILGGPTKVKPTYIFVSKI